MSNFNPLNRLLIFFSIACLSISCSDDSGNNPSPDSGLNYYPLAKGVFNEYRLYTKNYFLRPDSITNLLVPDSSDKTVFLRVINTARVLDFEGDSATRVEFYSKKRIEEDWPIQPDSFAVIKILNSELLYEINNRSFVKMIFPIKKPLQWDGNKYNNLGVEIYQLLETNMSIELDDTTLSPGIFIQQSNISNLIEVDKRTEEYVFDVGLARKNTRILRYRQSNGQILMDQIEQGTIRSQELIAVRP